MDPAIIASIIGAVAVVVAAILPSVIKRGEPFAQHRQRMFLIVASVAATMLVVGTMLAVKFLMADKNGWALGTVGVTFTAVVMLVVGGLGALSAPEYGTPKTPSATEAGKAPNSPA